MDEIQSDFFSLAVSHITVGILSTGDKGAKKVFKGKHHPSKRCRLIHLCRQGTRRRRWPEGTTWTSSAEAPVSVQWS